MKRQLSLAGYRAIDLTLFAVILAVSEAVMVRAATHWFPKEPYTVSAAGAVVAIVMMRWGPWAGIHAALAGLVFCRASGAGGEQYLIYCAGNLLGLGALVMRNGMGTEKIREDDLMTILFGLLTLALMQLGRAAVAVLLGHSLSSAGGFFTTDVISLLFTLVVMWISRRLDGIIEDQRHYLRRVAEEQAREKGGCP